MQKGAPGLRRVGRTIFGKVFLDRAFADSNAELEEFTAYALGAPEAVLPRHLLNECDHIGGKGCFASRVA
jgi:hypothetical protein